MSGHFKQLFLQHPCFFLFFSPKKSKIFANIVQVVIMASINNLGHTATLRKWSVCSV